MSFKFGLYHTLKSSNKKDISVDKKKRIIKSLEIFHGMDDKTYLYRFLELIFSYCKDQDEMFQPSVNNLPFHMTYSDTEQRLDFDLKDFPVPLRWVLYNYCNNVCKDM